jgi:glycosyltransferase involved in cell wall biosynthesis
MRVGIDLSPLAYGNRTRGIGTYAENLVSALSECDTKTEYVLITTRGPEPYQFRHSLPQTFAKRKLRVPPLGRGTPLFSHQVLLPLYARALGLDLLHCLAVPYNPSMPGVPYWHSVRTVITVFDLMPLLMGETILRHARYRRYYEFQLQACRRASHLISASEDTACQIQSQGIAAREHISVIPLAAPLPDSGGLVSPDTRTLLDAGPYFLHVGGNEPQKNQAAVLRAFGLLCRDPSFKHNLVLAGRHHLDDTAALRVTTRSALRIHRTTPASRVDMDALYRHCQALVFPSLYEGFGLPVLEAMRAGAPVITSNVSSLPEVGGSAALYVEPQDSEELASAMRRVVEDERLRLTLSRAGERRSREYSWARTAELTRRVYERAAAQHGTPA